MMLNILRIGFSFLCLVYYLETRKSRKTSVQVIEIKFYRELFSDFDFNHLDQSLTNFSEFGSTIWYVQISIKVDDMAWFSLHIVYII